MSVNHLICKLEHSAGYSHCYFCFWRSFCFLTESLLAVIWSAFSKDLIHPQSTHTGVFLLVVPDLIYSDNCVGDSVDNFLSHLLTLLHLIGRKIFTFLNVYYVQRWGFHFHFQNKLIAITWTKKACMTVQSIKFSLKHYNDQLFF